MDIAKQASQYLMAATMALPKKHGIATALQPRAAVVTTSAIFNPTQSLMAMLQKHGIYEIALHWLPELIVLLAPLAVTCLAALARLVVACLTVLDCLLGLAPLLAAWVLQSRPVSRFVVWLLPPSLALALPALLEWLLVATDTGKWRIAACGCGACFLWRYRVRQFLESRALVQNEKEQEQEHIDGGRAEDELSYTTLFHDCLAVTMGIVCLLVCLGLVVDGVPAAAGLVRALLSGVGGGLAHAATAPVRELLHPRPPTFSRRIGTLTRNIIGTSAAALHPHFASAATAAPSPANTATALGRRLLGMLTPSWPLAPRRSKHYVACSFAVEYFDPVAVALANMVLPILASHLGGLMTLVFTVFSDILLPHGAPQQQGGLWLVWLVQLLAPLAPVLDALFLLPPLFRAPSAPEVFLLGEKKHQRRGGRGRGFVADWLSVVWDVLCAYVLITWVGGAVQLGLRRPLTAARDVQPPSTKGARRRDSNSVWRLDSKSMWHWLTQGTLRAALWDAHRAAALGVAALYSVVVGIELVAGLLDWGKDKGVWFGKELVWQVCEVEGRRRFS